MALGPHTKKGTLAAEGSCVNIMSAGAAIAPSCETCTHADNRPDRQDWYLCIHIAQVGQKCIQACAGETPETA